MKKYFYKLIFKYVSLYARNEDDIIEINPLHDHIINKFYNGKVYFLDDYSSIPNFNKTWDDNNEKPNYILLNGNVHYERDIQNFLKQVKAISKTSTRIILIYYSSLWKPLLNLVTFLNIRQKTPEQNWITHEDIDNLLRLSDLELVKKESKILCPIYIPLISYFINRFLSPVLFFRWFNLLNISIIKPIDNKIQNQLSVSIVIPARNEEGNIEKLLSRIPKMGPDDEIIFVEGNSKDQTWQTITHVYEKYKDKYNIIIAKQDGEGKGDAVRKGFSLASKDIFMILDADISVQPEDLTKFYFAIITGKGEFINGSRLVYPMDKKAMRFFNIIGNKFFALGFSFVLGQRFKDTLCGTKVLFKGDYYRIVANRRYFGDFDPFGDFDLILGASRIGLRITEVPIMYKERTYGATNIQRWKHGVILLKMLIFSALKMKFI
ncbi:MAG: glycosyltransferase family 2 protein [Bacteroidales bacterium]|nr:glycosyltransferase family 2 protein [Bacteroidales bacterium]